MIKETDEEIDARVTAFKGKLVALIAAEPRQDELGGFLLAFGAGRMLFEDGYSPVDIQEQLTGALEVLVDFQINAQRN